MTMSLRISRRTALRGLGACVALPLLEAMGPVRSAAAIQSAPRRMAFVYVPNGVHMADWTPAAAGPLSELPPTLQPLQPFRRDLLVLSGLTAQTTGVGMSGRSDEALTHSSEQSVAS
jgi:hypothetical protein